MYDDLNYKDGWFRGQSYKSAVGYCHNRSHRGYLSAKNVKKHKCIEKGCNFFHKYENHPYWQQRASIKRKKKMVKIMHGSAEQIAEYIAGLIEKGFNDGI